MRWVLTTIWNHDGDLNWFLITDLQSSTIRQRAFAARTCALTARLISSDAYDALAECAREELLNAHCDLVEYAQNKAFELEVYATEASVTLVLDMVGNFRTSASCFWFKKIRIHFTSKMFSLVESSKDDFKNCCRLARIYSAHCHHYRPTMTPLRTRRLMLKIHCGRVWR